MLYESQLIRQSTYKYTLGFSCLTDYIHTLCYFCEQTNSFVYDVIIYYSLTRLFGNSGVIPFHKLRLSTQLAPKTHFMVHSINLTNCAFRTYILVVNLGFSS